MSDRELEELVSYISKQLKQFKAERSTAKSENNWWSKQQLKSKMNIDADSLKIKINRDSCQRCTRSVDKIFESKLQEVEDKFIRSSKYWWQSLKFSKTQR